ncbi:hypothetical protein [Kutzneria chonburiensis]|uniref:Uncharacterized protein n=1 Tax=Kutzneria chonburiensis TaxID=1483604 RepID=A0ABV6MNP4_9PSEU|nr:hypothetical protein [Kutzneria chonburiensis]
MRLLDITAVAHTDGNRIDLSWTFPDPANPPSVRVVRAERSHPTSPTDGVVVADGPGTTASDLNLFGERVYYYTLFPYTGSPAVYDPDPHNVADVMATSKYDFAGQLYDLLPAIYRRYDAERPPAKRLDAVLGQLRGFLDLPGAELDRLYSLNRAALGLLDVEHVDGKLLPLLAQWIGWQTDFGRPVGDQRNAIRRAPHLYQRAGAKPIVAATAARATGWLTLTKEFVHNVARTNQPERLNLWSATRDSTGAWTPPQLASLNFAYDGRPAAVRDTDGSTLFLYHTKRPHGWDIWSKRYANGAWQESLPFTDQSGVDKNPAAALQGDKLWVFWQTYDAGRHTLMFSVRSGGSWSTPAVFSDAATQRRQPVAVADNTGGVWLFWQEFVAGGWQVRYNRHNGTAWQLATPASLPADGNVEDDLCVLFHPATQRLFLFWANRQPGGPDGQSRWSIFFRSKQSLDPTLPDWSPVRALPKATAGYHDRQPAPLLTAAGDIELFFASTQFDGWKLSHNTLKVADLTWGANAQLFPNGSQSQRAPLAVDTGGGAVLAFRSNLGPFDSRYAGTTTVDTSTSTKLSRRGSFDDVMTYTYDTGSGGLRTNDDRIARDTLGHLVFPTVTDPAQIQAGIDRLAGMLAEVLPVTTRSVFLRQQ